MALLGYERFSRKNFEKVTWPLFAYLAFMSLASIVYGYDTSSFGGVQSIPGFTARFGDTVSAKGVRGLSAKLVSEMNSIAFVGKLFGCFAVGPLIEKLGHRWSLMVFNFVCFVGVIIQATSKHPVQFLFGRIILYFGVGITESVVPTYQSELAPPAARGAFVGSIQFMINLGGLIASIINKVYSKENSDRAWLVPVCFQAAIPLVLTLGLPFLPDSPRWLLSRGKKEAALRNLCRVRSPQDVQSGRCEEELDAIEEALNHKFKKLPWVDLFRGTNLRRTMIASAVFIFTQLTGQAFLSQYGPRFYTTVGFSKNEAFTYQLVTSICATVFAFAFLPLLDILGRRNLLLAGGALMGIWLYIVAGVGGSGHHSTPLGHLMVACTVLFQCTYAVTWAPIPHITAAELGTGSLREKTTAFSSGVNVIFAFLVSFTLPYLLNSPYAALGAKIGWIYGSFCLGMVVWTYFLFPETTHRSLEELDELFESRVSARKFSSYTTTGASHRVAELETTRAPGPAGPKNIDPPEKAKLSDEQLEESV